MQTERSDNKLAVFDIGGTWFRCGLYDPRRGLLQSRKVAAISYLSHPELTADELQGALVEFLLRSVRQLKASCEPDLEIVSISLGAPINVHDGTVWGSGPLWGPTAKPFQLQALLRDADPNLRWHIVNDVTALLAPYMQGISTDRKTMLITVSTGIGSRLFDHRARRIPYDATFGVQGEIGHLAYAFELDGQLIQRRCECGQWNHMNAFSSGRGIAQTLRELPKLTRDFGALFSETPEDWQQSGEEHRLAQFAAQLRRGHHVATEILDSFVTPLSRTLATVLTYDPEIDRIVITGGVAHGFGVHYRQALQRTFLRNGLYQITNREPDYLARRLRWEDADDFAGLRGAGIYALLP